MNWESRPLVTDEPVVVQVPGKSPLAFEESNDYTSNQIKAKPEDHNM
jgi:hypothetical protein